MNYAKTIFLSVLFLACGLFHVSYAAHISLDAPSEDVSSNSSFSIPVYLESEGDSVNTFGVEILFDTDALTLEGFDDSQSIVSFWIDPRESNGDSIFLSGILVGGFDDVVDPVTGEKTTSGLVGKLLFTPKIAEGVTNIHIEHEELYFGNGISLIATEGVSDALIVISKDGDLSPTLPDTAPPQAFEPHIIRDELLYDGKYVVVFSTRDDESGIDHYEIKEGRGAWVIATSPYLLTDQTLRHAIKVKAVDRAGNVTIETISGQISFPLLFLFILLLIICFVAWRLVLWYKRMMRIGKRY